MAAEPGEWSYKIVQEIAGHSVWRRTGYTWWIEILK